MVRRLVGVEVVVVVAAAEDSNELAEMVEAAVSKGCQLITTGRR